MLIQIVEVIATLIALVVSVCMYRAFTIQAVAFGGREVESEEHKHLMEKLLSNIHQQQNEIVERFSKSLQFKTVSTAHHVYNTDELLKLQKFIINKFPSLTSDYVSVETVNKYSLLISVKGSDPALKPYMLCAHLDVVPVEEEKWTFPPFSGLIKNGYIHGRGAIDIKCLVMAILESIEAIVTQGFKPSRSFYVAFGHDEEVMGVDGAVHIAEVLKAKGVQTLEFILDEGLVIVQNSFPGMIRPIALVGVAEKGFINVKLSVETENAGHSSMPPHDTAITVLAKQVAKFNSNIHPVIFGRVEQDMFTALAPQASFPFRLVFSNLWLFSPVLTWVLSQKPSTNAIMRTSTAVTTITGGIKDNVLPSYASAVINHRIHPEQTVDIVFDKDKSLVTDDRVKVTSSSSLSPSSISDYSADSFGFAVIARSLGSVFPDAIIAPGTLVGSTDTKHYQKFTKNIYRHIPLAMTLDETKMVHGHDERISVDSYLKIVEFYQRLILNSDKQFLR